MSHNYTYRGASDDFLPHQDMYADSYPIESDMYRPSLRSSSPTQSAASSSRALDSDVPLPGKALSFLHSCGLDPSDLAHLAELPEHLITVDTLPNLLLQIKERKLCSASPPMSSASRHLSDPWEGSSHVDSIDYPIDPAARSSYSFSSEHVQNWQDCWGDQRHTATVSSGTGGQGSSSLDYDLSRDTDLYYPTQAYASSAPRASATVSHSYADHHSGPKPLLSLVIDPPAKPPTRREACDFFGRVPPTFPHMCILCDITVLSKKEWNAHIRGAQHAKSQFELVQKYPKWNQSIDSVRRNESPLRSETTERERDIFRVPTRKEALDFHGTAPPCYPYSCVLCDITVLSEKDWSVHIRGAQHANSQFDFLEKYPLWDQTVESARRNDYHAAAPLSITGDGKRNNSRVKDENYHIVSFNPLPAGEGVSSELMAIAKRFGSVKNSLFLLSRGYVEMTHSADAKKLVTHYSAKQLKLKGKVINVSYSYEYSTLKNSQANNKQSAKSQTRRRSNPEKHSSQKDSPSPKRRHLSDKTQSSISNSKDKSEAGSKKSSHTSRSPDKNATAKKSSRSSHSPDKDATAKKSSRSSRSPDKDLTAKKSRTSCSTNDGSTKKSSHSSHSPSKDATTKNSANGGSTKKSSPASSSPVKNATTKKSSNGGSTKKSSPASSSPVKNPTTQKSANGGSTKSSSHSSAKVASRKSSSQKSNSSAKLGSTRLSCRSNPKNATTKNSSQTSHSLAKDGATKKSSRSSHSTKDATTKNSLRSSHTLAKDETSKKSSHSSQPLDKSKSKKPSSPAKEVSTKSSVNAEGKKSISKAGVQDSDSDLEGVEVIADDELLCGIDDQGMNQKNVPSSILDNSNVQKNSEEAPKADASKPSSSLRQPEDPNDEKMDEDPDFPENLENCVTLDELMDDCSDSQDEPMDLTPTIEETSEKLSETTVDPVTVETTVDPVTVHMDAEQSDQQSEVPKEEVTSSTAAMPESTEDLHNIVEQSGEVEDSTSITNGVKETFGKVLAVSNLPRDQDYTDMDFMNILNRYGKVTHFVLIRNQKRAFVEMLDASDAERVTADSKNQDIALRGNVLKIKVSEKYSCLPAEGFNVDSDTDDEERCKSQNDTPNGNSEPVSTSDAGAESSEHTNKPVGTEFVGPVVGYFCNLCKVIYASEEEAKDRHCRSQSHHERVKEHKANSGLT